MRTKPIPVVSAALATAVVLASMTPVGRPRQLGIVIAPMHAITSQQISPPTDPARVTAADICIGEDDSASEFGTTGSDPTGNRYTAAVQVLDYLQAMTPPQGAHRVAVVHFGSVSRVAVALTEVTATNLPRLRATLRPGTPLGATNFPAVIRACDHLLAQALHPAIFLVSDGNPDLGDGRSTGVLFSDIGQAIRHAHRIAVHVLLTIRGGVSADTLARWRAAGVSTVADLGVGPQLQERVSKQLLSILGSLIGVLPRPLGSLDRLHRQLTVDIPAYSSGLSVTGYTPAGSAQVRLIDPSGTVVRSGSGGIVVLSATSPVAGSWRVELAAGSGVTTVQADVATVQARLIMPTGPIPIGRPLQVTAVLGNGRVRPSAQVPLYVGASVLLGTGIAYELRLHLDPDGVWRSTDTAVLTKPGSVSIRLLVKAGSDTVLDSTTTRLPAERIPYLVADPVTVIAGAKRGYGWQLYLGSSKASDSVLGEDSRAAVTAQVAGQSPQRARYDGAGHWSIATTQLVAGRPVVARLSSRALDGGTIRDSISSTPKVVTAVSRVRIGRAATGLALTGVVMLLMWLVWLAAATQTKLTGPLREAPSRPGARPTLVRVRSRRWIRISGAGLGTRVVWHKGSNLVERSGLLPWPLDARPSRFQKVDYERAANRNQRQPVSPR